MRIGIDARFLTHPQLGGFKTYTENLIAALAEVDQDNQYFLYLDREPDQYTKLPERPNFTYRVVAAVLPFVGMLWREQVRLPRQVARDKLDLFHAPCLSAPLIIGCPTIVSIHDVIWHSPKEFEGKNNKPFSIRRILQDWYYRIVPELAARKSNTVITVSEASKRDIVEVLGIPPEKIQVTYPAASGKFREICDEQQITAILHKHNLAPDFILALGSADPRKNISKLLEAYTLLPASVRDRYQLVVVWNHKYMSSYLEQLVKESGQSAQIKFLEWVTNEDLVLLYNAAALFAFLTRYEGFGLPLLEAMACGTPIVAANNSSIPEIAGEAALLTDADDARSIAETIALALTDESLRNDLIAKGLKRAAFFSWEECANQTINVYKLVSLSRKMAQANIERSDV